MCYLEGLRGLRAALPGSRGRPGLPCPRVPSPSRRAGGVRGRLGLRLLSAGVPSKAGPAGLRGLRGCWLGHELCSLRGRSVLKWLRDKRWEGGDGGARGGQHLQLCRCAGLLVCPAVSCDSGSGGAASALPQRSPTAPLQDVETLNFFSLSSVFHLGTIESKLQPDRENSAHKSNELSFWLVFVFFVVSETEHLAS